jgi:hypothetical protein
MTRITLLAGTMALLVTAGCKGGGTTGDSAMQAMGAYAKGYNLIIQNVPNLFEGYADNVPEEGLTAEVLDKNGNRICGTLLFLGVDSPETVEQAFAEAKRSAPKELEHLAPIADDLLNVMKEALADHEAFCKYVKAEDYKDDGAKLAQAHMDKMIAHHDKYREIIQKFSAALDEIEFKQMAAEVARHEKDKGYRYWYRQINLESKKFLRDVESDPDNYGKHYEALAGVHEEFTKFVADKGGELNETFGHYRDNVDTFMAEAKKLNRTAAELHGEEKLAAIGDGFDKLVNGYNMVINWTETFSQLEQYDQL